MAIGHSGGTGSPSSERLRELQLQIARAIRFALRQRIDVFIDETLPRHGGEEFQTWLVDSLVAAFGSESA